MSTEETQFEPGLNGSSRCVLLLVEDNPAEADLVKEMLEAASRDRDYEVRHATRLADAMEELKRSDVDVMLLDLRLPDSVGVDTVRTLQVASRTVPIVVLTGSEEEELGSACIVAGAQDFINKNDIRPNLLYRALDFAMQRLEEFRQGDVSRTRSQMEAMSTSTSTTTVTATIAGSGPLKEKDPDLFRLLTEQYVILLDCYIEFLESQTPKPRLHMEHIVTVLGERIATPRDLLDLHLASLDKILLGLGEKVGNSMTIEGRLLALEMMGMLVEFYRVGHRRLNTV